jgi:hypothetical protein
MPGDGAPGPALAFASASTGNAVLSDEARAIRSAMDADAERQRRDFFDGRRTLVQGARTLGSLALVCPGVQVWTDPDRKRYGHDESLGGIVLEVTSRRLEDSETGEITEARAFRCYDPIAAFPDRAFRTVGEDLIPQDGVQAVDESSLRTAARRFFGYLATRRGPFTSDQERMASDAHRLIVVALGGTPL